MAAWMEAHPDVKQEDIPIGFADGVRIRLDPHISVRGPGAGR